VFGSGSISCDGPKECVSLFAGECGHCFAQVRGRRSSPLYVAGQVAGSRSNGGIPRVELRRGSRAADAMHWPR
jgi:hypothetical protein